MKRVYVTSRYFNLGCCWKFWYANYDLSAGTLRISLGSLGVINGDEQRGASSSAVSLNSRPSLVLIARVSRYFPYSLLASLHLSLALSPFIRHGYAFVTDTVSPLTYKSKNCATATNFKNKHDRDSNGAEIHTECSMTRAFNKYIRRYSNHDYISQTGI